MESDDDLIFSVPAGAVQSPVQQTKLKRLKKASNISTTSTPESSFPPKSVTDDGGEPLLEERPGSPIGSPSPIAEIINISGLVTDSRSIKTNLIEEESVRSNRSFPSSDNFENEEGRHVNHGFSDELGALSQDGQDNLGSLDDCTAEAQEERNPGCTASVEIADVSGKMSAKKRSSTDGDDEKRRRKKKVKNADADCNPETPKATKRRLAKEKKCYLDMIHAESQRLLRETRDASFRPAPVVQKPISSVLEKIRQRKLEVLRKSYSSDVSDSFMNNDASLGDTTERRLHSAKGDKSQEGGNDDKDCGLPVPTMGAEDDFITVSEKISPRSVSGNKCDHGTRESISSALIQEHSTHSQSHSEDNQLEDGSSEPSKEDSKDNQLEDDSDKLCEEEYFSPSVLAEKLNEESILSESDLSEEEDDDKENIDPHPGGDPVKAFVDDEAEEEDDSDRELMIDHGSSDENEEKETGEHEEFKDLIASGYEEKAVDTERRDELHQKWLQQQDAAETENILQILKCGVPQKAEESLLYDEEEYDQCDRGSQDEEMPNLPPVSGSRIKTKELKLMISKMFTDSEDPFLSDEEENETRLARQLYHNKSEEAASFLSPVENDSSREVFGLIKKLNIAPENKRRAKTSSFLETLVKGSNGSSSSKSSFLGRAHSSSLPSARKQGVATVRSFVFGRDDSNSRSGISTSAESADLNRKEKQQAKKISAKHSTTSKSFSQEAKKETRTASGPSLFQILRASSVQSSASVYSEKLSSTSVFGQTQADYHFTAFKSSRKTAKVET
ncbi:hypothetical protein H6P81_021110 [Aristolochia fimbriata]|uniref:Claspin n=1 Tax=Aristolochia fimbriata TaxID=158543 RepID=A0AAV7DWB0_ARIFI|nr:hypothetical protein H6P81_021110 [Aristolochia fimbriata]